MDIVSHEVLSSGQVWPYGDSRTIIRMTTTPGTDDEAWAVSAALHTVTIREHNELQFDGACGFPHGLSPFGTVRKASEDGTQWTLVLIYPYCD